jgi:hypothetical protein
MRWFVECALFWAVACGPPAPARAAGTAELRAAVSLWRVMKVTAGAATSRLPRLSWWRKRPSPPTTESTAAAAPSSEACTAFGSFKPPNPTAPAAETTAFLSAADKCRAELGSLRSVSKKT